MSATPKPKNEAEPLFNPDPDWQEYIRRYEAVYPKLAAKFTEDDDFRLDVIQEARIALATIRPEKILGAHGPNMTEEQREAAVDRYCRNVIRNSMLGFLQSYRTGPWDSGRTILQTDKETGQTYRVYQPARFASFDLLSDEWGMQVDTRGRVSWDSERLEDGWQDHDDYVGIAAERQQEALAYLSGSTRAEYREDVKGKLSRTVASMSAEEQEEAAEQVRSLIAREASASEPASENAPVDAPPTEKPKKRQSRGVNWQHGTNYGYTRGACRCGACCAAHTEYERDYRARRALRGQTKQAESSKPNKRTRTKPVKRKAEIGSMEASVTQNEQASPAQRVVPKAAGEFIDHRKIAKPLTHGTTGGYRKGCRCDDCRMAHNAYKRDQYARAKKANGAQVVSKRASRQTQSQLAEPRIRDGLRVIRAAVAAKLRRLNPFSRRAA